VSLYVDSSALLKRYVEEPDSERFEEALLSDPNWVTARVTVVEVRRNLIYRLRGREAADARTQFERDWRRFHVVELDEMTCDRAAELAELTGVRSLDALHLAAMQRIGAGALPLLTADIRQAQAARSLGWTVLGA
jgi:uncharacterized protein